VAKLRDVLVDGSLIATLTLGLLCAAPTDVFAQTAKSTTQAAKVDLNSASEADLDKLPGVGKATAKKIIAGRPYQSVDDLSKAGVPKSTIEKIAPLVTVTPASPTAATPVTPAPAQTHKAKVPETTKSPQVEAKTPPAPGMVWVNTNTKIFHREGDRWYGKTKEGKFMTEAEALKEGYRPSKEGAAKKSAKE
jgi:hypothetical protein